MKNSRKVRKVKNFRESYGGSDAMAQKSEKKAAYMRKKSGAGTDRIFKADVI